MFNIIAVGRGKENWSYCQKFTTQKILDKASKILIGFNEGFGDTFQEMQHRCNVIQKIFFDTSPHFQISQQNHGVFHVYTREKAAGPQMRYFYQHWNAF